MKVFVWAGSHYCEPFTTSSVGYGTPSVTFNDWTNDEIIDVIFDWRGFSHGPPNDFTYTWSTQIITCESRNCRLILDLPAFMQYRNHDKSRHELYETEIARESINGTPLIYTRSRGFNIIPHDVDYVPLVISPIVDRTYQWNGTLFELVSDEQWTPQMVLPTVQVLSATSSSYSRAYLTISESDQTLIRGGSVCTLWVDDERIAVIPLCYRQFIQVHWQDVTNDGVDELLFVGIGWPSGKTIGCLSQWVTIYQLNNGGFSRIQGVSGCIVESDLYGVRIEDIDGDGQVEIIAAEDYMSGHNFENAPPDRLLPSQWETVYRYNGTQFVQAETIPRP